MIYQGLRLEEPVRKRQAAPDHRQQCGHRIGAKVLGSFTIGDNCNIGSNAVVLRPVPQNSTVVGNPGKIVKQNGERVRDRLDHTNLPDPIVDMLRSMQKEIDQLRAELHEKRNQPKGMVSEAVVTSAKEE